MRRLIASSFIIALMLSVFPMDVDWRWFRPEFVALMVIYWSMYAPEYVGIPVAWCIGLLQDIIEFSLLGPNALGLSITAYLCQLFCQRIGSCSVWQQAGYVFILIGVYLLCSNYVGIIASKQITAPPFFLFGALVSAFLWPLTVFFCGVIIGRLTRSINLE